MIANSRDGQSHKLSHGKSIRTSLRGSRNISSSIVVIVVAVAVVVVVE